ncbi:MAG: hypothetical protein CBB68_02195 [Rhodospirillaceae bacterium TMED8]|nr:hypothetical protein [Magnetovibrio sp.]OUT52185.1 MAG: hypothetical protein CBB68_02195 [Rhodospirillaceae bacterium TMED8]
MNNQQKNVFGSCLELCGLDPITGFYRNGCCNTGAGDVGTHTICAIMTDEFLNFSRMMGNDLISPKQQYGFPGLSAGDRWCLCALRWLEAWQAGTAPRIRLTSTNAKTLELINLEILRPYDLDLN